MESLQRFTGAGRCPKCLSQPAGAKYCERDCSKGECVDQDTLGGGSTRSVGGLYTSDRPPLGSVQPPEHLHRVCRCCGFEWLEQCADAVPAGNEAACAFCLRPKSECHALGVAVLDGALGAICAQCVENISASLRQLQPKADPQAKAH